MKKPKHVDVFGYKANEFEDWWKGSAKKMLKRAKKREAEQKVQAILTAPRHSSCKLGRHQPAK